MEGGPRRRSRREARPRERHQMPARRNARKCLTSTRRIEKKSKNGIMAQRVMVIDVFVAQRDRGDALADQRAHTVDRAIGITSINEASGHPIEQADGAV